MKDVEKTSVEAPKSRKRIRRRNRMQKLYALVVVILAMTALITISYTFLFNVDKIKVSGESDMYTAAQIVGASGIENGDNLLRLHPAKSEQKILDNLLYVETAAVKRKFPSSVEIKVTKCIPAFNVQYENGILLISKKGKILADNGYLTDNLPVIYGYDPADPTPGRALVSSNEHKNAAFDEIVGAFESDVDYEIMSVDMTDEFGIMVNYSNGNVFKMGSWSDVRYKLDLAKAVMADETVKGKTGYLTMIGTNQCSFRTTDDPAAKPDIVEPTSPPATDANGIPIMTDVTTAPTENTYGNEFGGGYVYGN